MASRPPSFSSRAPSRPAAAKAAATLSDRSLRSGKRNFVTSAWSTLRARPSAVDSCTSLGSAARSESSAAGGRSPLAAAPPGASEARRHSSSNLRWLSACSARPTPPEARDCPSKFTWRAAWCSGTGSSLPAACWRRDCMRRCARRALRCWADDAPSTSLPPTRRMPQPEEHWHSPPSWQPWLLGVGGGGTVEPCCTSSLSFRL
mmetsp:Transcript_124186/g.351597  ORF Transcript_124186/g.351597 Transcript_124186/m.351597 type:complete len:204 (-) Transcript_124186:88-699(-)